MKLSQCLEYRTLPIQFYIFTLAGVWCPSSWKSLQKVLYGVYTAIIGIAVVSFWLTALINVITTKNKSVNFYKNIFATTASTYAMYKEIFVLKNRKKIQHFLKVCFENEWYRPYDVHEIKIIRKYKHETRWITKAYAIGILAGIATNAITPIFNFNSEWELPIETWYPYKIDNLFYYCISYTQQLIGGIPLICLHISVDSLFVGLALQMCSQLKLLQHRIRLFASCSNIKARQYKVLEKNKIQSDAVIAQYAHQHACILRFGKYMNEEFKGVMTGQILSTIPNICINVYLLSQHRGGMTLDLIEAFLGFGTCLMQMFLYCWYGEKTTLYSLDVANAAYTMNWLSLNVSSKKKLLTMMVRATRTIKFATGTFSMNMNSFIEILRTSYSAYSVLQRTSR